VLAEDAASLERLTKLFFQLVEQPLADRHEVSGPGGGPVEVEHGGKQRLVLDGPAALAVVAFHEELEEDGDETEEAEPAVD
jgi:hypothetical protein